MTEKEKNTHKVTDGQSRQYTVMVMDAMDNV